MKNKMNSVITIHMVHLMSFNHSIIQLCSPNTENSVLYRRIQKRKDPRASIDKTRRPIKEYVSSEDDKNVYV